MKIFYLNVCWLALLAATGCGASEGTSTHEQPADPNVAAGAAAAPQPSSEGATAPAVPTVEPEVIERLEIGTHKLTFHRVMVPEHGGPEPSIMLHEIGTLDSADPVAALMEHNGLLTMLEIFKAYAGPNRVAHEALVASHAVEAQLMGRPDARAKSALIPKAALGAPPVGSCSSYVYPDVYPYRWTQKNSLMSTQIERNAYICAGDPIEAYTNVRTASQPCKNKTRNWVTAATCNDGFGWSCSGGIVGQAGYGPSTNGPWTMYPPVSLPNGSYQRWAWGPTPSNQNPKGMSAIGVPNSASGNPCTAFHVLSGVAVQ
jgi:hypothetical protein